MMTCVSLRSGIASRGNACMDHQPPMQANAVQTRTRSLCFTEKSMMRLIMTGPRGIQCGIGLPLRAELFFASLGAKIIGDAIARESIAFSHGPRAIGLHAAGRIVNLAGHRRIGSGI